MQSEIKDIYKITSARTGVNENVYKTIGDFIFKETKSNLEKPKSLIIMLKGLGFWYLRRTKIKEKLTGFPLYYDIDGYNEFDSKDAMLKFINKQEFYKLMKARLLDYDKYLSMKAELKQKKDEFKEISKRKKESESSSKDQL